ncbi:MAG: TauD/TfdA family dioxygenase [Burkholderiaceae bacterium]
MSLHFSALHPVFAAQVDGIKLTGDLDDQTREMIELGLAQYGVLVLRGQALDEAAQMALGRRFGPIEGADRPMWAKEAPASPTNG